MPDALRYPTLVTLVFDHLTQNSRTLARRAALQFVAREMPANQWVAVYALEQRLRLAQTFTRDINELKIAIERATAAVAEGRDRLAGGQAIGTRPSDRPTQPWLWSPPAGRTPKRTANIGASISEARVAEVTARMERMVETADSQQRGQSTLFPLMALMKAQGTLAGRKALLFFSEGLPIPPNLEEAYRSAISEANRANVSIYAVDARGLDTGRSLEQSRQMLDRSGRNSQAQQAFGASQRPVTMDDVMNSETAEGALRADTQSALQTLAEETSGALIANKNDLGPGLVDRVTADLASYYEIGYAPAPSTPDGHFRAIAVKTARKGLTVHSRSGYFALPDTDAAPLMPFELPMLAAAAADPPPHRVRLRGCGLPVRPIGEGGSAHAHDRGADGTRHVPGEPQDPEVRAAVHGHGPDQGSHGPGGAALQRSLSARGPDRPRAPAQAGPDPVQASVLDPSGPLYAVDDRARSGDGAIQRASRCRSTCRNNRPAFGSASCP